MPNYPPTPQILQWLAASQLANRMQRAVRLWVILTQLYGSEPNWASELPKIFTYPQLRSHLFSPTHPQSDRKPVKQTIYRCYDNTCICHRTLTELIFTPETQQTISTWQTEIIQLTGLSATEIEKQLQLSPFATVHRSIRDDLKQLVNMGWLQQVTTGSYRRLSTHNLPTPPTALTSPFVDHLSTAQLPLSQTWELLRVLESIAFVQPNLELVVRSLWEQITANTPTSPQLATAPTQRIFIHLDYILPPEIQDQVDTYQEQIEQLWHQPLGGIIQFNYWVAEKKQVTVTVYPVGIHYVRRAKYLSAYGIDPNGEIAWHNYRLDRIASKKLTILAWGDPQVPKELKQRWHTGQLPTPEEIQAELDAAWGFNFYLPKDTLIIRFPAEFARWYVDNTMRHPTFERIDYKQIPKLIKKEITHPEIQQELLEIIKARSPKDYYYQAKIRVGDINVMMRLRDWRPKGEVIAPLSIRQKLSQEATQELNNYQ